MNIYILNGGLDLKNKLQQRTHLLSFFDSVVFVDIVQNLYPILVKKSGSDPFLLILPEAFYSNDMISKVFDFLPAGIILVLCDSVKSYLTYHDNNSHPNCFYTHKDLTNVPNDLITKLQNLRKREIIIPNTRYTLRYYENEILYMESQKHRIRIHTNYHEDIIYSKFSNIVDHLTDQFLRVHQSYIINRQYITELHDDYVVLNSDIIIPVSRTYSGLLRTFYKKTDFKSSERRGRRKKTDAT